MLAGEQPAGCDQPATSWEGRTAPEWSSLWGLPELHLFQVVNSTNDTARLLAERGAPGGTVVLAEEQTEGRGRRGRHWVSPFGKSLLLSIVLRPDSAPCMGAIPLRVGIAIIRAVSASTGIGSVIKWPNDILLGGRKLAGVLCEGTVVAGRPPCVVAGIGINVSQHPGEWPQELEGVATSLSIATGRACPRSEVVGPLVRQVLALAGCHAGPLEPELLQEFSRYDALFGRRVSVDDQPIGTAEGIEADGALRVRDDADRIHRIRSGSIRTVP